MGLEKRLKAKGKAALARVGYESVNFHSHTNLVTLGTINQNMATTDNVTFNSLSITTTINATTSVTAPSLVATTSMTTPALTVSTSASMPTLTVTTLASTVDLTATGVVKMTNLPTADPLVAGQLWNNSGVLTVSAG